MTISELLLWAFQLLVVLPGAVACAARFKYSKWAGLAAFGFALQVSLMALLWCAEARWVDIWPQHPFLLALASTPWLGIVAIACIVLGVGVIAMRTRSGHGNRWAIVVVAGATLHAALLLGASAATRLRWHMNPFGRPDGALAVGLPAGHVIAQLAILAGVFGVMGALRVSMGDGPALPAQSKS